MVSKSSPELTGAAPPKTGDDLKQIPGIGPAIERRLHDAGIFTFAALAAVSPSEIAALFEDMKGVMRVDVKKAADWNKQARQQAVEPPESTEDVENHQHYATFTIQLLLDQENQVRRTKITHVKDREEKTWAGWDENRMVAFINQQAGLYLPGPEAILIAKQHLMVLAKNSRHPTRHHAYEHVVVDQELDRGILTITGTLFRESGDRQLNEDVLILVDGKQVFVSRDRPGMAKTESFGPVVVNIEAGQHTVIVRHADDSEKPEGPGSIEVDIEVSFAPGGAPLAPLPDKPTLEITEVIVQEVGGIAPSNIIGVDQNWSIHIEWQLSGVTEEKLTGNWLVRAYLESMGPSQEYSLPMGGVVRAPMSNFTKPGGIPNTYQYVHDISNLAGIIEGGVYKLVVSVTSEKETTGLGYLAAFLEHTSMVQMYIRR